MVDCCRRKAATGECTAIKGDSCFCLQRSTLDLKAGQKGLASAETRVHAMRAAIQSCSRRRKLLLPDLEERFAAERETEREYRRRQSDSRDEAGTDRLFVGSWLLRQIRDFMPRACVSACASSRLDDRRGTASTSVKESAEAAEGGRVQGAHGVSSGRQPDTRQESGLRSRSRCGAGSAERERELGSEVTAGNEAGERASEAHVGSNSRRERERGWKESEGKGRDQYPRIGTAH